MISTQSSPGRFRSYRWCSSLAYFTSLFFIATFAHTQSLLPLPLQNAYSASLKHDAATNEIVFNDGTRIVFGQARAAISFDQRLATATLYDQLSVPYPREWPQSPPQLNCDPGRLRCDAFFKKMYGDSAAAVESNLVRVPWPPAGADKTVRFTKINAANKALEGVGAELAKLPADVRSYVAHPNGTFNWRPIEGTDRLSPHSYGVAIDFEIPKIPNQYWRWTPGAKSENYPVSILQDDSLRQIVETFERHGFIWGGKWYHFDLMHFEYRPELLQ